MDSQCCEIYPQVIQCADILRVFDLDTLTICEARSKASPLGMCTDLVGMQKALEAPFPNQAPALEAPGLFFVCHYVRSVAA